MCWTSLFSNHQTNKQTHNGTKLPTSSGVSLVSGWPCAARRAITPARILLRLIWRSGGGPPRGWPRTMMAQPDKTWREMTVKLINCRKTTKQIRPSNTLHSFFFKSNNKRHLAIPTSQTPGANGKPQDVSHTAGVENYR